MTHDSEQTAVVAICDSRASAEATVDALHREGLDLTRMSIDTHTPEAEQQTIDAMNAGAFVVLVHGTAAMIVHAHAILGTTDASDRATPAPIYNAHASTAG